MDIREFIDSIDNQDLSVSFNTNGLHNTHVASNVQVDIDDEKMYISYIEGNDNIDLDKIYKIEKADVNIIHLVMEAGDYWISNINAAF